MAKRDKSSVLIASNAFGHQKIGSSRQVQFDTNHFQHR
jgi:hypothetical protein